MPRRSPDLTPMDVFFWGFVKSNFVYFKTTKNKELKEAVYKVFEEIDSNKRPCKPVCLSFPDRMAKCINVNGK